MPFVMKKVAMRLRNNSEYIPLPGVRGEAGPGVPTGGTTGQVLAKASNTDYDAEWVNQSGGGGTSDYDDLTDKPSINNVTLSGNKTAAQLGLATPNDIPTVPVQSVNGKTGAVMLTASDVSAGTYSKPSGGIPKTDLASAVQTSLGKADSALQSVPSTYRTAEAQDAIDATQDAEIDAKLPLAGGTMTGNIDMDGNAVTGLPAPTANSDAANKGYVDSTCIRPNLLDNWYFVGGGSQNGAGIFPINQRGQVTYSGIRYGIDKWRAPNTPVSVTLNSEALQIDKTNALSIGYTPLRQEIGKLPAGIYTATALIKSATGAFRITAGSQSENTSNRITSEDFSGAGLVTVTGYLSEMTDAMFAFVGRDVSNSNFEVIACKLELGSYQTLAHNEGTEENPIWVLNEIPNFDAELLKCQHKYWQTRLVNTGFVGMAIALSTTYAVAVIATPADIEFPTPMDVSMVASSGGFKLGSIAVTDVNLYSKIGAAVAVRFIASGLTVGQVYAVTTTEVSYLYFNP